MKSRYVLYGIGAIAALLGGTYLLKLKRLSIELESVTKVSIHKVSLTGLELRIDVTLKNPSGGSIRVKQPFVKLLHGTTVIASSQVVDTNINIPKFSEVNLEPVRIAIGFLTLASTVPKLMKEYRSEGKLTITAKTVTTINDSLPYTKTEQITLGGGKPA